MDKRPYVCEYRGACGHRYHKVKRPCTLIKDTEQRRRKEKSLTIMVRQFAKHISPNTRSSIGDRYQIEREVGANPDAVRADIDVCQH
jgi:hypothetical protein